MNPQSEPFHIKVAENLRKAFYDLLEERVGSDPPDYEWIGRLYQEIRGKLIGLLRKGHPLRIEIEAAMDIQLFDQMIRNKAFDPNDLGKLVCYVFNTCKQLGSPARDRETDAKKQELVALMQSDKGEFKTIVPLFIRSANECLDKIYEDLSNLSGLCGK